ncbi:MAG: response regulator transcription factor [Pseudobutyrivibrio sp.]|nr:response regulator transcription factor [Pseudobutyrivibrio sp.]
MKILFLEDDQAIAMGLIYSLENENYTVNHVKTVAEAKETFKNDDYDLCLLDVNLPDGNGYEVCKEIKNQNDTPVIFLTAYDDEVNVVMGLELGADDYICKPFRVKELMARIKTVIRRNEKSSARTAEPEYLSIKNIRIYVKEAKVVKVDEESNKEIDTELTAVEYRLLLNFVNNKGNVLTRNQLLQDLWDVSGDFVNDNTLTVYIKRLRDKIEIDPTNPEIIKTVRGLGYILEK